MISETDIVVVGLACKYPDANGIQEFWENILSRRRAFRNMPEKRLSSCYFTSDKTLEDFIYSKKVAVLKDYTFDRIKYRIPNSAFLTADFIHWLALDIASTAIKSSLTKKLLDANREYIGVVVGNSLTSEFSRANVLRLRWPYMEKTIRNTLTKNGFQKDLASQLLAEMETDFKKAFPPMEEDSLAGSLSNVIAGRICNYYNFKGGGYTIDGACSSSLLAVSKACDSIASKELRIAIVGGIDLSLDPFELVGFSRAGALACHEMLIYDQRSSGFWPGEGCGFIILTDYNFAKKNKLQILASIKGWGISSDGIGGLTRPSAIGHGLAIERAYKKTDYTFDDIDYMEGHGTGTQVGDEIELKTIINCSEKRTKPLYLGSVKANIGHTKAAAGIAGLIKSILVIKNRVVPPTTGCKNIHNLVSEKGKIIIPFQPIFYRSKEAMKVGISAMGFGGINVHLTLEENISNRKRQVSKKEKVLCSSHWDTELFLFSEKTTTLLKEKLELLLARTEEMAFSEMTDAACSLFHDLKKEEFQIAIVADTPETLKEKIIKAIAILNSEKEHMLDTSNGIYYSSKRVSLKLGFLFPGQGNHSRSNLHRILQLFPFMKLKMDELDEAINGTENLIRTDLTQPAIVKSSVIGIKMLKALGVYANVSIGHSLGEYTALYYTGILSQNDLENIVRERGRMMQENSKVRGKMLGVNLSDRNEIIINDLIGDFNISLAAKNSDKQLVFSGETTQIQKLYEKCIALNIPTTYLNVENAFHSSLMKSIESDLKRSLTTVTLRKPKRFIFSTVTGKLIEKNDRVKNNLVAQLTQPVLFYEAIKNADPSVDVWIEIGDGNALTKILKSTLGKTAVSLDLSDGSIKGLLNVLGLVFVSGNSIGVEKIFRERFYRKYELNGEINFIGNPCETIISKYPDEENNPARNGNNITQLTKSALVNSQFESLFKNELATKLKLPTGSIDGSERMLDDLRMNSLYVGHFLAEFSHKHNLKLTDIPTEYSNAKVAEIVDMFLLLNREGSDTKTSRKDKQIEGISNWLFPFKVIKSEMSIVNSSAEKYFEGQWTILGHKSFLTTDDIKYLKSIPGKGILVLLYEMEEEEILRTLSSLIDNIFNLKELTHVAFIQENPVVSGFAKSCYLELKNINFIVLTCVPRDFNTKMFKLEAVNVKGFCEVFFQNGKRQIPEWTPLTKSKNSAKIKVDFGDVIIVTGGAQGITFECVKELGLREKCKFIILGRSPMDNEIIRKNLDQLIQYNIRFTYFQLDIADSKICERVIPEIIKNNEKITGFIHGAGINNPCTLSDLNLGSFINTLKPKLFGFRNVMKHLSIDNLKFCFVHGSIIAETGMERNADYALANEWLKNEVSELASKNDRVCFVALQWSVWGGVGMGQNLGVLEKLKAKGIIPISLDDGIRMFLNFFTTDYDHICPIITGRFSKILTVNNREYCKKSFYRFLEDVKVYHSEIEIITECILKPETDLYLRDHSIDNQLLFPGVMGMEAMMQLIKEVTLDEKLETVIFSKITFFSPITLTPGEQRHIRILVQRRDHNTFIAAIRTDFTDFHVDHFRATIEINNLTNSNSNFEPEKITSSLSNLNIDLYDSILFHKGIFKRITHYEGISPYHCNAVASVIGDEKIFSKNAPGECLVLNNPTLRDSSLHVIQACVPNVMLIPISVEKLNIYKLGQFNKINIYANELDRKSDVYTYRILVFDDNMELLEQWTDVKFRVLKSSKIKTLTLKLLENVLKRKLDELCGDKGIFNISFDEQLLGLKITNRSDGKPLVSNYNKQCSNSYLEQFKLTTYSENAMVSCDIEKVVLKEEDIWLKLLANEKFVFAKSIQSISKTNFSNAATRVWGAWECLRKSGNSLMSPLSIIDHDIDGTFLFSTGVVKILSYSCFLKETKSEIVTSILIEF